MSDSEVKHVGCRLCVIEEHSKQLVDDNDGDQGRAMAMCYVAGFAEHMVMSKEMSNSMCIRHGVMVARYAIKCVQMLAEMLEKAGAGETPELPPIPSGKDTN